METLGLGKPTQNRLSEDHRRSTDFTNSNA